LSPLHFTMTKTETLRAIESERNRFKFSFALKMHKYSFTDIHELSISHLISWL